MLSADETTAIRHGARRVPVEIFKPRSPGRHPGVVVIHEVFGLNDDIRRIARRFGDEGYVAAAPDLTMGGHWIRCMRQLVTDLQAGSGPAVDELEAVIALLEARPDVTRVGTVGFCMGGG